MLCLKEAHYAECRYAQCLHADCRGSTHSVESCKRLYRCRLKPIRLGWKYLTVTNALAYNTAELITVVISFINLVNGKCYKTLFFVTDGDENKLECLFLQSFFRLA